MKTPGGWSVGIQDVKGATSSNPHVNTGAKPGRVTTGATQSHRDAEARSDGNHSKQVDNDSNDNTSLAGKCEDGTVNIEVLCSFSIQNRLEEDSGVK